MTDMTRVARMTPNTQRKMKESMSAGDRFTNVSQDRFCSISFMIGPSRTEA